MQWTDIRAVELMFDNRSSIVHECNQDGITVMLWQVKEELANVGSCTVILKCKDREYGGIMNWPFSSSRFLIKFRNEFVQLEKENNEIAI